MTQFAMQIMPLEASPTGCSGYDAPPPQLAKVDEVDQIVNRLATLPRASSLQTNLEVGALIFNYVFAGDRDRIRSRQRKPSSFRSLASDPRMPFSSTSLWRAVAAYELSLRMPELNDFRHVGIGHVSVVLGLPLEVQRALLRAAECSGWSRKMLRQQIGGARAQRGVSPPEQG